MFSFLSAGEKNLNRKIAQEVITKKLLICESAMELGEALGAIGMAKELGLITDKEETEYKNIANNKHLAFLKAKEEERKRRAAEYKAEVAARKAQNAKK